MFSLYFILKFIHIAAVIFWIGGIGALTLSVLQAGKQKDPSTLAGLMGMSVYFGQRVIGPASVIALLTGIGIVISAKIGFMTLWVQWGFVGWILHVILGTTVLRKNGMQLGRLASSPSPDPVALSAALARQKNLAMIYLLTMLSVVWVMVAKPT